MFCFPPIFNKYQMFALHFTNLMVHFKSFFVCIYRYSSFARLCMAAAQELLSWKQISLRILHKYSSMILHSMRSRRIHYWTTSKSKFVCLVTTSNTARRIQLHPKNTCEFCSANFSITYTVSVGCCYVISILSASPINVLPFTPEPSLGKLCSNSPESKIQFPR